MSHALIDPRRSRCRRALVGLVVFVLHHTALHSSVAPARGGGPQTGSGTSDVVRTITPPKDQQ